MDKEKLAVTIRKIWKQKDSKMDGWNDVADYILDNFVAKSDVERDYVYMGGTHNPCAKQEPQTKECDHKFEEVGDEDWGSIKYCPKCFTSVKVVEEKL